jgi:cell division topological specificity factor
MLNALFKKLLTKEKSKDVAKKRLQFALIYDQMEVSEETLGNLQKDIVGVLSRYFVIDEDSLKLEICRDGGVSALVVNTPILKAMRARGAGA